MTPENEEIKKVEEASKPFSITQPGKIAYASERGQFQGCAVRQFWANGSQNLGEVVDDWFTSNPGYLIVDCKVLSDEACIVFYTRSMSDEEIEVLAEYGHEIQVKVEERRQKNLAEKKKQDDANQLAVKELKKLADVGRKCLDNHGKIDKKKGK